MPRRPPRHDQNAGGSAALLAAKAALRQEVWQAMQDAGVARFPGAEGRIPNFTGAEAAAERLRETDVWRSARAIKANPDAAQWPVRQRALADGKLVYMAVPRLAECDPFFVLDPEQLADSSRVASSIKGAVRSARRVAVSELGRVDLVVCGCVAAGADGARLGKGGGFADLEFALAAEAGLVGPHTPVVTTVHELQVRDAAQIPVAEHDIGLDLIATPDRTLRCQREGRRVAGIRWSELTDDKIAAIPLLAELNRDR
jgi:5-formyltetrahydrofolate cyclo-ligase